MKKYLQVILIKTLIAAALVLLFMTNNGDDIVYLYANFWVTKFSPYDGSHLHFESAKKLSILLRIEVSKLFENQTSEDSQNNNY